MKWFMKMVFSILFGLLAASILGCAPGPYYAGGYSDYGVSIHYGPSWGMYPHGHHHYRPPPGPPNGHHHHRPPPGPPHGHHH